MATDQDMQRELGQVSSGISSEPISSANLNSRTKFNSTALWTATVALFNSLINNKANNEGATMTTAKVNGVTLNSTGDGTKVLLDDGNYAIYESGGGGTDVAFNEEDDYTDTHIYQTWTSVDADDDSWCVKRHTFVGNDPASGQVASIVNNPTYLTQSTAWAARAILIYA
tara:strand:+ start:10939 stop:11448 length:510 start_codon:yes stop_codon:yes gene_type:complete